MPGNRRSASVTASAASNAQRRPGEMPGNRRPPSSTTAGSSSAQRRPGEMPGNRIHQLRARPAVEIRSTKAGRNARQPRCRAASLSPGWRPLNEGRAKCPATASSCVCVGHARHSLNEGRAKCPATASARAAARHAGEHAQRRPGEMPGNRPHQPQRRGDGLARSTKAGRNARQPPPHDRRHRPLRPRSTKAGRNARQPHEVTETAWRSPISAQRRPGEMPGNRRRTTPRPATRPSPLNEGRAKCPATASSCVCVGHAPHPLNEGRAKCPATADTAMRCTTSSALAQRRPGEMPGNRLAVPAAPVRPRPRSTKAGRNARQPPDRCRRVRPRHTPAQRRPGEMPGNRPPAPPTFCAHRSAQRRPGEMPGNRDLEAVVAVALGARSTKAGRNARQPLPCDSGLPLSSGTLNEGRAKCPATAGSSPGAVAAACGAQRRPGEMPGNRSTSMSRSPRAPSAQRRPGEMPGNRPY